MKNITQNKIILPGTSTRPLRVLRLTLTRKWFDMINSGEKKEEYRIPKKWICSRVNSEKEYDAVEFKNGYGKHVPCCLVEYKGFRVGTGKKEWGAHPSKEFLVIQLGEVLCRHEGKVSGRSVRSRPQPFDISDIIEKAKQERHDASEIHARRKQIESKIKELKQELEELPNDLSYSIPQWRQELEDRLQAAISTTPENHV